MSSDEIGGYIGAYGLSNWWLRTFSPEERDFIEGRLGPMGGSASLTKGRGRSGQPLAKFLTSLAGWFMRADQVHVALRILERARAEPMSPIEEHFYLMAYIEARYKQRGTDAGAVNDVVDACERMIEIAPSVIEAMKAEHEEMEERAAKLYAQMGERHQRDPFPGVPNNPAFKRLIAIRKKQGNVAEVNRLQRLYHKAWEVHTIDYRRAQRRR